MGDTIHICFNNGQEADFPAGTSLEDIIKPQWGPGGIVVAAKVNNELKELNYVPEGDCRIEPLDLRTDDGIRIYCRSLSLVLVRAANELYPGCKVTIEHSLSKGIFGELYIGRPVNERDIRAIEERMHAIINADEPIEKITLEREEAIALFKREGQMDKVRLLQFRNAKKTRVYHCGDLYDYYYGYMTPRTGYLQCFGLKFYLPGFILRFPQKENPTILPPFVEQRKLASVYYEFEQWGKVLEVQDVASLNTQISSGRTGELIRVAEALHEKKLAQLADEITKDKGRVRVILIAGPSSSGKTTFAQRLCIQLRVNGLRPITIGTDDYFVDRVHTPVDEKGEPDYEALEALDLELFNQHLISLIQGEEVEIPIFNFHTGKREPKGLKLSAKEDQPIIIEGIHGLNERLTSEIPKDRKFKIYISALTQLNVDDHNRIPTTDNRLLRRIVRDNQFRSHDAKATIRLWPSVRRGEERNIFPFQEDADAIFNSALVYELAILKHYAEPLLHMISKEDPEYPEAKRLLKFLSYILPMDESDVPMNSILREFIGQSCFAR
jgi:uridine kinase